MRPTSSLKRSFSAIVALLGLAACSNTPAATNDAAIVTADAGPGDSGAPLMCAAIAPGCVDQQISMLDLFTAVSARSVTEEGTGATHVSHIDSMGGGVMPSESYVYARFTDAGLVRVDVSDQDAFASQDWDIAFRRFIIRLNSGVSGPSCVQAARLPNDPGTGMPPTFDSVTSVPAGITFHSESYMTDGTCDIVADGSGLGSPATVLSSFWTYPGCVSMSHNVYVVTLATGRHVKLEVLGYYNAPEQTACDGPSHTMPMVAGSSGNIRVQWSYLD